MTLTLTVGLPRSGKSTWAKRQGVPVVNPDAIRLAIHGQRYQPLAERYVWAVAHTMVQALFLAGHEHVIVDATNTTDERRVEWHDPGWETYNVLFEADEAECVRRAEATGDTTIIPIIRSMAAKFQRPATYHLPDESLVVAASPQHLMRGLLSMTDPYSRLESALGRLRRVVEPVAPKRLRADHSNTESVANSARGAVRDLIAPAVADATDALADLAPVAAERDALRSALERIASNLCNCHANPGGFDPPPADPALHAGTCSYAAAHAPIAREDETPLRWGDDNLSLA